MKPVNQITRNPVAMMTKKDIEILIHIIKNVYDVYLFKDKVVYPEALSDMTAVEAKRYTKKWKLSNYNHFRSVHQTLLPIRIYSATKKFN